MHKLALINIIQYCLGEDSCARILLSIQNRAPSLNMVYNAGFANSAWEEHRHPRAKDGKFASSPGGDEPEVTREEIDDDFARRMETMDDLGEIRELERLRKGRSSSRRRDGSSRHGDKPEGKSVNLDEINDTIQKANVELENLFKAPFFESGPAYQERKAKIDQLRDEIDELYERKWKALKKGHGDKKQGLSGALPTQQPKPAGRSWLERLEKARDESDEEAIINVTDENGDVHEFTPEELDAEIRKHTK